MRTKHIIYGVFSSILFLLVVYHERSQLSPYPELYRALLAFFASFFFLLFSESLIKAFITMSKKRALSLILLIGFLSAVHQSAFADEKKDAGDLKSFEKRLKKVEENQEKILDNQKEIKELLRIIKIRI